jgi:hypothetical protein
MLSVTILAVCIIIELYVKQGLGSIVFAPDVKHKYRGNEEERHYQYRYWSNFDARRIFCVEAPHTG